MAYSWTNLVASGGQQNFAFSIPFLNRNHIHVYKNDIEINTWSWQGPFTIRLNSPASSGDVIRIQRITPIDNPVVDFVNGSPFSETELDAVTLQSLYHRQEIDDLFQGIDGTAVQAAAGYAAQAEAFADAATAAQTAAETAQGLAEDAETAAEAAQAAAEAAQAAAEGIAESTATTVATTVATSVAESVAEAIATPALLLSKGKVVMYRTAPETWIVVDENGEEIDISSSTTSGLQEAIDYACEHALDLHVYGGGIEPGSPATDPAVIQCSTGLVFPPMQNKTIRIGACTVNFTNAVTGTGVFFDSCMMVDVDWNGQIVYTGNGAAVLMQPTNPVPYDAQTAIVDSKFKINHIALVGGTNPTCWHFDSTNGPIMGCMFESFEINGINQAGSNGIVLGDATNGILANVFDITRVHLCKAASLAIGTSTTEQANIHSNLFRGHIFGATGGATVGIKVYGAQNSFMGTILNNEGALTYGVHWESGAANNSFIVFRNNATTAVQNDSGGSTNKINFA